MENRGLLLRHILAAAVHSDRDSMAAAGGGDDAGEVRMGRVEDSNDAEEACNIQDKAGSARNREAAVEGTH